jgi:hypothetical protein
MSLPRIYTSRRAANRMGYLNYLIRLGWHPLKRANWLKFCHRCGADISTSPRRETLCGRCKES